MLNLKTLASRLNRRVEIYRPHILEGDFGDSREFVFYKKVWGAIIPLNPKATQENGYDVIENSYKILVRKCGVNELDIIKYQGKIFEIINIIPRYNNNSCLELICKEKKEYIDEF